MSASQPPSPSPKAPPSRPSRPPRPPSRRRAPPPPPTPASSSTASISKNSLSRRILRWMKKHINKFILGLTSVIVSIVAVVFTIRGTEIALKQYELDKWNTLKEWYELCSDGMKSDACKEVLSVSLPPPPDINITKFSQHAHRLSKRSKGTASDFALISKRYLLALKTEAADTSMERVFDIIQYLAKLVLETTKDLMALPKWALLAYTKTNSSDDPWYQWTVRVSFCATLLITGLVVLVSEVTRKRNKEEEGRQRRAEIAGRREGMSGSLMTKNE